ncbi:hypothetical protein [Paenibacillus sp. FSL L8-0323]|uniref:hypothetical protein n=1 Tax=unclassified Paenibacillus TaxID=185978 RepID=UPI0030FBF593
MTKQSSDDLILKKVTKADADLLDVFGVTVALLYSKSNFNKNQDIERFLKSVFDVNFLPYVMRSRTLIVARITRDLNQMDEERLEIIRKNIIKFINENKNSDDDESNENHYNKKTKKKDANEKMKTWLEKL